MTSNSTQSANEIIDAHKQFFSTKQAEVDAEIMTAAFDQAQAPDDMSRMRSAAEYFRQHAAFAVSAPLTEAETRQDVFVVARAYAFCIEGKVAPAEWMKWIACCFRVQAAKAAFAPA
ncbi:hypothetical protein [Ectopseudomonas mendocina]|jgi:predicted nuclease of restriction endonuclease-like RecB superfamily|uniref:TipAS antibiotic-recognition domain-containing protein n=1 Tax=Ectopseudomonas mendocina S5.2 TaxID=1225174 RepID=A0ABM5W3P2_ECTME|nr:MULTISPECIES: hypothetical protein [Pseudomonas aeruginosa group]ALN21839.1 hypothetical protein DW68_024480 [Pseudomonas mendocina S5.2]KER98107.1 hypothetical protein HN51_25240 [Pseudomonas mendocina]